MGFNALQMSCDVCGVVERDGMLDGQVGGCGATVPEVSPDKGVKLC